MTRRIAGLFVTALLGVLVVIGLALSTLGGAVLAPYLVVAVLGLGLLVRKARAMRSSRVTHEDGRTCSCCTSTVFDPMEIR